MIPVEPGYLYSIKSQASLTWRKIICELVDNSFNAGAQKVRLNWKGGRVFCIDDDGAGAEDLMPLINLGSRCVQATNDIGHYGVGAKQAMVWLWGTTEIESRTPSLTSTLCVDWDDVASGNAEWPKPSSVSEANHETGLSIECRSTRGGPNYKSLIDSIASTYTPALECGKVIQYKQPIGGWKKISGRKWPETSELIEDTIVAAGRPVSLKMGIVKEGCENPYVNGFSFERTFRVIKESTLGANGFSVSRIAARIKLGHEWHLSTNKDEFYEFHEELAEAIHARCFDLLEKGSTQAISIEDSQFAKDLAKLVGESAKRKRESRNASRESVGTVEPQYSGVQRTRASQITDEDGSVIVRASAKKGFKVETYEDVDLKMGTYDPDTNRVRLNVSNSHLSEMWKQRDNSGLILVIYGILSEYQTRNINSKVPLFHERLDGFCSQWGASVARAFETGGMVV